MPVILVGIFAIVVFIATDYEKVEPSFFIIIIILTIYVFFFGLAIGREIAWPVKQLLGKATELSEGKLSSRVYLETKDELAELARIFNKLAEELQASHAQEANMENSVNIKVKARTKDLEETINSLEQKVKNRTIELERLIKEYSKLQEDVKNKGTETIQLKKELADFNKKIGKYKPRPPAGRQKQEIAKERRI